jgi:hypothetical protein
VKFALKERKLIDESVEKVNTEFGTFLQFLKSLQDTFFEIAALKFYKWRPLVTDRADKASLSLFLNTLLDRTLKKSVFYSFNEKGVYDFFVHKNKVCWDKMVTLRQSAVCSICSGRSNVFFTESRANIDQEVCYSIIDRCWNFLRMSDRYFNNLSYLGFLQGFIRQTGGKFFRVNNQRIFDSKTALNYTRAFSKGIVDY